MLISRPVIVAAAETLFSSRGYANTTIEDIADVLGVRKGALYYHIPRKVDLLIEIMRSLLLPLAEALAAAADLPVDPRSQLLRAIEIHVSNLLEKQAAARIFFEERRELPPDAVAELNKLDDTIRQQFERIIAQGQAAGAFHTGRLRLAALQVLALCNWPYRWYRPDGGLSAAEVIASVQHHAIYGLCAPQS